VGTISKKGADRVYHTYINKKLYLRGLVFINFNTVYMFLYL